MADELDTGIAPADDGVDDLGVPPASQDDPPATDADDGKPKDGVQDRINELTRKRHDAERDAAYWRGQAESKPAAPPAEPLVKAKKADDLNPEDFDDNASYMKAYSKSMREEIRLENAEDARKQSIREAGIKLEAMKVEGRKVYEDFDETALANRLPVTQTMLDTPDEGNVHKVLYYLGKNPAEASRISTLPATQQIKEIGLIEAKLAAAKPVKKTETKAPEPPVTVGGGGKTSAAKSEADMKRPELHKKWEAERRAAAGVK